MSVVTLTENNGSLLANLGVHHLYIFLVAAAVLLLVTGIFFFTFTESSKSKNPSSLATFARFFYASFLKPHSGDGAGYGQQAALESFYKAQVDFTLLLRNPFSSSIVSYAILLSWPGICVVGFQVLQNTADTEKELDLQLMGDEGCDDSNVVESQGLAECVFTVNCPCVHLLTGLGAG